MRSRGLRLFSLSDYGISRLSRISLMASSPSPPSLSFPLGHSRDLEVKIVISAAAKSALALPPPIEDEENREGEVGRAEAAEAEAEATGRWKLDTRFISWSDCDFRRSFKYWKYRARGGVQFTACDPIGFYKRGKSTAYRRGKRRAAATTCLSSGSLHRENVTLFFLLPLLAGGTAMSRKISLLTERA